MLVDRRTAIHSLASAGIGGLLQTDDRLRAGLCASGDVAVPGFEAYCFTDNKGTRHPVYVTGGPARALGLNPEDVQKARQDSRAPILGIRYREDRLCKPPRFTRLAREFEARFFRMDLDGQGHSTLAFDFCPEAFDEVRLFLNQYLRTTPDRALATFPQRARPSSQEEVTITGCPRRTGDGPHDCHRQSSACDDRALR